jgi:hypothetical protein
MAKANQVREDKVVVKNLGGKDRIIQFDLNAIIELEKKFGTVKDAMEAMKSGSMTDMRMILWAGLIHQEAILNEDGEPTGYKITPYQVGSWVSFPRMNEISQKITQALINSSPDLVETLKNDAQLAQVAADMGITVEKLLEMMKSNDLQDDEVKNV